MSSFRQQAAELWQECANLTRKDIFGPEDDLRPTYVRKKSRWQIDVVSVGMVGKDYRTGGLVILSVNPSGGKKNYKSKPESNRLYRRLKDFRNSDNVNLAFKKANKAFVRDYPNWSITKNHYNKILVATTHIISDIAFVHVVPFRTKDDKGSTMKKIYLDNGYVKHLKRQLDLLSPSHIIAMDRPSEKAAIRYKKESATRIKVTYYNRGYHASAAREKTLKKLKRMYSRHGGGGQ